MNREFKVDLDPSGTHGDYLSIVIRTTETTPKSLEHFSVQYVAVRENEEFKVVRYDSSHGIPHRHLFNTTGKQIDRREYPGQTLQQCFERAREDLTKNWKRYRADCFRQEE